MIRFVFFVLFILSFGSLSFTFAAPLGTIPEIDTEHLSINLDLRSDVWTSPNTYKHSPIRIFASEFKIPLAHGNNWKLSANLADESLSLSRTEFSLKNKNIFVGNNLQSQSAGLGFYQIYENGSAFSLVGQYASASDYPNADIRNRYFEGILIYQTPRFSNYTGVMALTQSENRGLANGRPFPMIGLQYQKDANFQVWYGFPFVRVIWQKPEEWRYEFQATPFGAFVDSQRPLTKGFQWHARASLSIRSYLYENRTENENRLFFQETTFEGGVRRPISDYTFLELSAGYAFDRKLYESDSVYAQKDDKTSLESDFIARIRIGFTIL